MMVRPILSAAVGVAALACTTVPARADDWRWRQYQDWRWHQYDRPFVRPYVYRPAPYAYVPAPPAIALVPPGSIYVLPPPVVYAPPPHWVR